MTKSKRKSTRSSEVRKLGKTGTYTYFVTIPRDEVSELGWREGQKLVVKRVGSRMVVEDWEAK